MPTFQEIALPLTQLLLDPNNYRFHDGEDFVWAAENRFHVQTVQDRANRRLRNGSLQSLKNSIIKNGFIPVDRIAIRSYQNGEDLYLVVEGNRRVAALRWIAEDIDAGVEIPNSVEDILENVPVLLIEQIDDDPAFYEALMGIRHVGGIKQWGGYQRAKLVSALRDDHNLEGSEVAERLGMSTQEVNRRYRAYKALDQMSLDEEYAEVANPDMYPIFHEAVSLPAVRDWLEWDEELTAFQNEDQRHQFYDFITPTTTEDDVEIPPKLRTYADVRELREILPNEEAKRILLDPSHSLFDAISIAKQAEFSRAWKSQIASAIGALKSIGALELADFSVEDLEEIHSLIDIANKIVDTYRKVSEN